MANEKHDAFNEAAEIVTAPLSIVGNITLSIARMFLSLFDYIGGIFILTFQSLLCILGLRLSARDILLQMSQLGVDSLLIVTLCLSFTGMVFSLIIGQQAAQYGFGKEYIGVGVVYAMCKELGPVLGGLVMAGRAGAGMTSQIGSMQVTEQIDALKAMAVSPVRYLVVPRILAMAVMVPVVIFISTFAGVVMGYYPAHLDPVLHLSASTYFNSIEQGLKPHLVNTLFQKSLFFGIIIAIVGCLEGFKTRGGAEGVGVSVTRAVVISMVLIFFTDLLITKLYP